MRKYDYLKKYTAAEWRKRGFPQPFLFSRYNQFGPTSLEEIEQAEAKLGFQFPSQLREFYLEIGCGNLVAPYNTTDENYHFGNANEILPPMVVAEFYKPLGDDPRGEEPEEWLHSADEQYAMSPDDYEVMKKGCMPFFNMHSSRFLTLMPHSSTPNAVWNDSGKFIVEESFERFIWRLYYEDPAYYDDIITGWWEKQASQTPHS
jgi:hypothetical protein